MRKIMAVVFGVLLAIVFLGVLQQVFLVMFWKIGKQSDTDWSGEHPEPGPVPHSIPGAPVLRLVNKKTTFPVGEQRILRWDDGKGPVEARERIKPLLDSVPKELSSRLTKTIKIPSKLPGRKELEDYPTYETWGIIVSLNPDVMILSAHELPGGNDNNPLLDWDTVNITQARSKYIYERIDPITNFLSISRVCAGTLVPWNTEIYVISTEPTVTNGRLQFNNNRAEILLPKGKLILTHHNEDVDVIRE